MLPAQRIRPVRTDTAEACWIDRETRESTVAATLALVAATLAQPKLCTYACRCTVHYIYTQEADTAIHIPEGITEAGRAHRLSRNTQGRALQRCALKPSRHQTEPPRDKPTLVAQGQPGRRGRCRTLFLLGLSLRFRLRRPACTPPAPTQHSTAVSAQLENVLDGS